MTSELPSLSDEERAALPDFIIGGAMKSGTSSLHYLLAAREDVYLPDRELGFWDLDDARQHADFFLDAGRRLRTVDLYRDWDRYFPDYRRAFEGASPGQLVGEDSTTYLASPLAPPRIARGLPDVRMIFLLRDPVDRALSHYWHLVRTFRATRPLEETLVTEPRQIFRRSSYRDGLLAYRDHFPADRLLVLPFERLVREPRAVLDRVAVFLDLPPAEPDGQRTHYNPARYPRFPALQLWYNRRTRRLRPGRFRRDRVPGHVDPYAPRRSLGMMDRIVRLLNMSKHRPRPAESPAARELLTAELRERNRGLEELVAFDPARWWDSWR